ncbi:hypothetical protein E4U53_000265 [Claviceps sorghi]|nr:hypothetical protein E4U53_000265 [Claviceps sorghi]
MAIGRLRPGTPDIHFLVQSSTLQCVYEDLDNADIHPHQSILLPGNCGGLTKSHAGTA